MGVELILKELWPFKLSCFWQLFTDYGHLNFVLLSSPPHRIIGYSVCVINCAYSFMENL